MKVALVTGASRGIGRAIALSLASDGLAVAVHYDKSADAAQKVVSEITESGGRAIAFQGNLASPDVPADLVARVKSQLGSIDILVNNAAVMTDSSIAEMSDEMWLKPTDCKSVLARVRRFESVPSNKNNGKCTRWLKWLVLETSAGTQ